MTAPAHAYLDSLIASARKTEAELIEVVTPLSATQLNWKPNPQSWSVGEVVDHIITSNAAYFGRLTVALPEARAKGKLSNDALSPGWMGKDFLRRMEPGAKKVKTYKVFEPQSSAHDPAILTTFQENQTQLRDWIEKSKGLDLNRIKIKSPLSGLIRFQLGVALSIMVTHQARHLEQAKSVINTEGFPSA